MSTEVTTICLVRHGETEWNLARRYQGSMDIPLNDTGLSQAEAVATAIADESWDALYSSPLQRAMQTAEAIARKSGITEILTDPDLQERAYGVGEGLTLAEREETWPGTEWPGLEPYDDMADRAMAALGRIAEQNIGKRILVTCHGGVIGAVLARISGGEVGTGKTVIVNTSRSTLEYRDGAWEIETVSDASHLELAGVGHN